jgi:mono/diheme cytochrome c family protein
MRNVFVLLAILIVFGIPLGLVATAPEQMSDSALGPHTPDLENGRAMFLAGGCASCHATPGQEDPLQLGGGLDLKTSFGTFRAPNISPHMRDGIGAWGEVNFLSAMSKGASPEGEHYFPAFPYTSYQRMHAADLRDLFAYMRALPEVAGRAPDHDLPFPFYMRAGVGFWKLLHFDGEPFRPDPSRSELWNRGAYLVEGPGHCAECHSPRDFSGGIVKSMRYAGGPSPAGEGFVPNITQHALAGWSEENFERLLETGETPEFESMGGDMAAVIRNISHLSAEDRKAMAHYLKSLPPVAAASRN